MADGPVAGGDAEELASGRRGRPSTARTPRTGRTNDAVARSPAHRLREGQLARRRAERPPRAPRAASLPGIDLRAATVLPRGESTTTSSATSTFWAFANPSAARVGFPSASNALDAGGPRTSRGAIRLPLGQPAQHARPGAAASRRTRPKPARAPPRRAPRSGGAEAPGAPASAPAPGSPPSGFRKRSLGCSLGSFSPPGRARPAPSRLAPQTAAGSGSESGNRDPSLPDT